MGKLALDNLKNNPKSQVLIVGSGISVKGFVINDFTINGSNDFQSIFELTGQEELQKNLLIAKGVADRVGLGKLVPSIRIKSVEQSELTWISSNRPTFNLQLLFLSLRPDDIETKGDIRKAIMPLLRATYPAFDKALKTRVVTPPLGYDPKAKGEKDGVKGTVNVHIGQWWRATNQVIQNVNVTYSKEVVSNGTPLYANITVEFGPYRMISADEMEGYFRSTS